MHRQSLGPSQRDAIFHISASCSEGSLQNTDRIAYEQALLESNKTTETESRSSDMPCMTTTSC